MRRFMIGLVLGGAMGAAAWYTTYNVGFAIMIGSLVALAVWFAGDFFLEVAGAAGEWLVKQVLKALN